MVKSFSILLSKPFFGYIANFDKSIFKSKHKNQSLKINKYWKNMEPIYNILSFESLMNICVGQRGKLPILTVSTVKILFNRLNVKGIIFKQGPIQHKPWPSQTISDGQNIYRLSRQLHTVKTTEDSCRLSRQLKTVANHCRQVCSCLFIKGILHLKKNQFHLKRLNILCSRPLLESI